MRKKILWLFLIIVFIGIAAASRENIGVAIVIRKAVNTYRSGGEKALAKTCANPINELGLSYRCVIVRERGEGFTLIAVVVTRKPGGVALAGSVLSRTQE